MVVIKKKKKKSRDHRDFSGNGIGCSEARFPWQQEQQNELKPLVLDGSAGFLQPDPLAPNPLAFPTIL